MPLFDPGFLEPFVDSHTELASTCRRTQAKVARSRTMRVELVRSRRGLQGCAGSLVAWSWSALERDARILCHKVSYLEYMLFVMLRLDPLVTA